VCLRRTRTLSQDEKATHKLIGWDSEINHHALSLRWGAHNATLARLICKSTNGSIGVDDFPLVALYSISVHSLFPLFLLLLLLLLLPCQGDQDRWLELSPRSSSLLPPQEFWLGLNLVFAFTSHMPTTPSNIRFSSSFAFLSSSSHAHTPPHMHSHVRS
jgi:hypothetical protein